MYQALYRKWRPHVFEDVSGQPHITLTLKNEVMTDTVAHAYLFTGSRGTGKTTCAKILAKAVNCLHPVNGDPCNECENCRGIDSGSIMDVVEIDAASNNGFDNIRDLREESTFSPVSVKYRVYIIDEAHMLSGGAFNALLKTLEEPPAYVIFILATTEVQKIPATILSRCQRFDFRRISIDDIVSRLGYVAEQEQIGLTQGAASLIARLADGAMRDALSLLDRCAGTGDIVDEEAVTRCAGLSGRDYLFEMTAAIKEGSFASALITLDRLYSQSKDVERLCEELINHFRGIMLLKSINGSVKEIENILNIPPAELERLKGEQDGFTLEAVLHILDTLQRALESLHRSTSRRVEMEMCLLRLCNPGLDSSAAALGRRMAAIEEKLKSGVMPAPQGAPFKAAAHIAAPASPEMPARAAERDLPDEAPAPEPVEKPEPNIPEPAAEVKTLADEPAAEEQKLGSWPEILDALAALDPPLRGFLGGSAGIKHGEYILVDSNNSMFAELIRKAEHQKPLLEAVRRVTGKPYKVGIFKKSLETRKAEHDGMDELSKNAASLGLGVKEK